MVCVVPMWACIYMPLALCAGIAVPCLYKVFGMYTYLCLYIKRSGVACTFIMA